MTSRSIALKVAHFIVLHHIMCITTIMGLHLKCYSQILCGMSAKICRFWLFVIVLVSKYVVKKWQNYHCIGSDDIFSIEMNEAFAML